MSNFVFKLEYSWILYPLLSTVCYTFYGMCSVDRNNRDVIL